MTGGPKPVPTSTQLLLSRDDIARLVENEAGEPARLRLIEFLERELLEPDLTRQMRREYLETLTLARTQLGP